MTDSYSENQRLATLIRLLLEAESNEDSMICHDGGFRYSGDFMSMEADVVEPAAIISNADTQELLRRRFVETVTDGSAIRVTDAGRHFAATQVGLSRS